MKYIHFYATARDILPLLKRIDEDQPLKYIQTGKRWEINRPIYLQASEIPSPGGYGPFDGCRDGASRSGLAERTQALGADIRRGAMVKYVTKCVWCRRRESAIRAGVGSV